MGPPLALRTPTSPSLTLPPTSASPQLELTEYQVHHLFGEDSPPEFVAHLSGEGQKCAAVVCRRIRGNRLLLDLVGPDDVAGAKESAPERCGEVGRGE